MFGIKSKDNRPYPSIHRTGITGGPDWGKLTKDLKYALDKLPEGELIIQTTKISKFHGHYVAHGTLAVKTHGRIETFPVVSGGFRNDYMPGLVNGTNEVDARFKDVKIKPYKLLEASTKHKYDWWKCDIVGNLSNPAGTGWGGLRLHHLISSTNKLSLGITEGCLACPKEVTKPFEEMIKRSVGKHVNILPSTTIGGLRKHPLKLPTDEMKIKEHAREAISKKHAANESGHKEINPLDLAQLPREKSLGKYT